jgi:hypothetical protein
MRGASRPLYKIIIDKIGKYQNLKRFEEKMGNQPFEFLDYIQGVVLLSGLPGSGKTTAAMTISKPSDIVVLDYDLKDEQRCRSLGNPYFRPEMDISSDPTENDLAELLDWTRQTFKSIAVEGNNGRETLVIDNGSPLEDAFAFTVLKNPSKYGVNPKNAQTGAYGGVNPGVAIIWQNTIRYFLSNGFKRIIICMHMSQSWANGLPIEKMKVKGNKVLSQLSNLSVVLEKSDQPNRPPIGLIGKEALGLLRWDDNEKKYHVSMALPPRIMNFEWGVVSVLIDEFSEGRKKKFSNDELWTPKELEQYSPWLSDSQKEFILTIARNPNFSILESEESIVIGDKQKTQKAEGIDQRMDWNGFVQYCYSVLGMDIDSVKDFIIKRYGRYQEEKIPTYLDDLNEWKKVPVPSITQN